jgi:hypothetical protein
LLAVQLAQVDDEVLKVGVRGVGQQVELGDHLTGMVAGQPAIALVCPHAHTGEVVEQVVDALGLQRGLSLIVHTAWPYGTGPQQPAGLVADDRALDGVAALGAADERFAAGPSGLWAAHGDVGGVDAQVEAGGLGVGQDVGEGAQPWSAVAGGVSACGDQRSDGANRPADVLWSTSNNTARRSWVTPVRR